MIIENKKMGIRFVVKNNEDFKKWITEYDKQIRSDAIKKFVNDVLCELNGIAEDESYYFDKDNANLVSSVMYGNLEQLKESKNE